MRGRVRRAGATALFAALVGANACGAAGQGADPTASQGASAPLAADPTPLAADPTPPGSLVAVRLRPALERLFQDPAQILEIGIRKPSSEVEKSRAELERFFKGAELTDLDVPFDDLEAAAAGRFSAVPVRFEGLTLVGLRIDRATFRLEDLEVDTEALEQRGEVRVRSLGAIRMKFRVGQQALDATTSSWRVRISRGRFSLSGLKRLLVLPLGVRADGLLRFTPEGQINFHDRSVTLNGLPLPGLFRRAVRKRINPVFDLAQYLGVAAEVIQVRFLTIRHLRRALELEAIARIDTL